MRIGHNSPDRPKSVDDLDELHPLAPAIYRELKTADKWLAKYQLCRRVGARRHEIAVALGTLLETDVVDRRRPAPAAQPHYLLFRELTNDADTSNGSTD